MRILQITPTFFADHSVIGGGERYVNNVCAAVQLAADRDTHTQCDILSFGNTQSDIPLGPGSRLLLYPGHPDNLTSCAGEVFDAILASYDVVHVHQCLTPWGIFVAARAHLLGVVVLGTDHGGGESRHLESYPVIGNVFHAFHAQSEFAAAAFSQLSPPCHVILGPADEMLFPLNAAHRDPTAIIAIGRILPHKGYEHAIAALPDHAKLTIIGRRYDGDYFAFLQHVAKGKNVDFLTNLSDGDMLSMVQRASLLVHAGVHVGYTGQFYAKPELLSLTPLEAMFAGTPAVVSSAGALPELASVIGCRAYRTQDELTSMLDQHVMGKLFDVTPSEIRDSAIKRYGLWQFGQTYLQLLGNLMREFR
ncbi:glycosyltransferase family 4 protein [Paraburkholderia sp. A2RI-6]|uniref:glycosyltransferase family 4 protein n=1 Tax=Paraburkholderia sp. A2RI-6 TaxID=3028371 RepID=UPI003B7EF7A4